MQIALRKNAPSNATLIQRVACWAIRARLVSQYSHGGIVIDGWLYHSTMARGLHKMQPGEWTPERWDLIDIGGDDEQAKKEFENACTPPTGWWKRLWWRITKGYDAISLIAFAGPSVRVSWLHYCFELCYRMRTGRKPNGRVTAETLLMFGVRLAQ